MKRQLVAALGAVLWMCPAVTAAGSGPEAVRWNELGARVGGNKVALVLPDGTHLEGRVREVEPGGLRLRVSKTSDRKVIRKGEQLIPRASVTLLRVTEYRKLGRLLTTVGALGAAAAIVASQSIDVYEGPMVIAVPAVIAGGMVGVGVGGYYTGKALDKRVTEIRIEREQ